MILPLCSLLGPLGPRIGPNEMNIKGHGDPLECFALP